MDTPQNRPLLVAGLRCTTAALAILSTRHVMSKGLHFPYHLLLVHALTILLFLAIQRLCKTFRGNPPIAQDQSLRCSNHTGTARNIVSLVPCLYISCVVGTLLCVYQAAWHFTTIPVLTMLLVLDWSSILGSTDRHVIRGSISACIALCGMAMMLVFDRKLTKGGIIGSLVAIMLTGLARAIDAWIKDNGEGGESCPCAQWRRQSVIPLLVVLISPALIRRYEYPNYIPIKIESLGSSLALNLLCVLAAWRLNWPYFSRPELPADNIGSGYISGKELMHLVKPVAIVGIVTAGSSFDQRPFVVSAWQHVGFLVALSAIYIASHLPKRTDLGDAEKSYELLAEMNEREPPRAPVPSLSKRIGCVLAIASVAAMLCFTLPMYWPGAPTDARQLRLTSAGAAIPVKDLFPSLDFVISRYDASASLLANNLLPLLEHADIDKRATRIMVYNTGEEDRNSTFLNELQTTLGSQLEVIVKHRANVGREGAAFLHHITSNWDSLADHTLFMQAQPHDLPHMQRLLHKFFIPQTGFLSLSDFQDTCSSCAECWDRDTWSESSTILEDIYNRVNHGAKCDGFVLTYRGQFVASRKRIQTPGKQLFQDLLNGMMDPNSDKHSEEYVQQPWLSDKIDSLNAPNFGYTLERIWGVLMGCSDRRMAWTCPSRLSTSTMSFLQGGSAGGLEDCQCLDEEPS